MKRTIIILSVLLTAIFANGQTANSAGTALPVQTAQKQQDLSQKQVSVTLTVLQWQNILQVIEDAKLEGDIRRALSKPVIDQVTLQLQPVTTGQPEIKTDSAGKKQTPIPKLKR